MRKRHRSDGNYKLIFEVIVVGMSLVITGIMLSCVAGNQGYLHEIAEKAALASTMTALPDKTTLVIRERFNDELDDYADEGVPYVEPEQKPESQPKTKPEVTKPKQQPLEKRTVPKPPTIPTQYRGDMVEEFFGVAKSASAMYVKYRDGYIKNSTKVHNNEVEKILSEGWSREDLKNEEYNDEQPLVLIYHTHATESFEPYDNCYYDKRNTWRSTDNNKNITKVGDIVTEILENNGIKVIHNKTQHDYPSYNGCYERSAETIRKYLEKYPSIQITLDIHRDAIQREDVLIRPICQINGKKAAQVMLIAGCDDGNMNMPNWRENLRFGAALQDAISEEYEGLARPLFFAYRKYNQDLCQNGLLLEVGSHSNTLEEACYSGELVANALVKLLTGQQVIKEE